jgi:small subunit ribosomal protein S2
VSDLEKLGSTQNRSTTFRPHHALHRPLPTSSLTLSHLVASGAHLGHSTTLSHPASFPLIYGTRAGISVIDLRQTLTYLRRAAEVVRGVVERDGLVVFLGTTKGTEKAIMKNAQRLGRNGYGTLKWLPGTITNASKIFEKVPLYDSTASESVAEEQDSSRRPTSTTAASFMPSLLVLLSPRTTAHALREANLANIPTIGIVDTDVDPRAVTYPIPANDDSPRTVELIAGVLGLAGQDGLERQRERCVAVRFSSSVPCMRSDQHCNFPRPQAPAVRGLPS